MIKAILINAAKHIYAWAHMYVDVTIRVSTLEVVSMAGFLSSPRLCSSGSAGCCGCVYVSSTIRFPGIRLRSRGSFRKNSNSARVWALVVDPSDSAQGSVNEFVARMEKAWLISKQPRPVSCVSCKTAGDTECPWCKGTGFFILGDNMLCEVPSRNTKCLICLGRGSVPCKDCKGTGYIAKWLYNPSSKNKGS